MLHAQDAKQKLEEIETELELFEAARHLQAPRAAPQLGDHIIARVHPTDLCQHKAHD